MTAKPRVQSLIFEVTQRCNHACLHCYNTWQGGIAEKNMPYPRGELDTSRTKELLAKALDETICPHVTLTGGEPLLRPDLVPLVDFLHGRRVQTTLISNGRLLDEAASERLIEAGIGLFELPLLSARREVHDGLSGKIGAWDAVLAAMANIRLHHGQFAAAFVATRKNILEVREVIRLAFAFGARAVMFNRFNPGGRGEGHIEDLLPSAAEVRQGLAQADEASREFGVPIACSIPIPPCLIDPGQYKNIGFGYCAAGSERAYYAMDPLGNLRPCNHTNLILGNLLDHSFEELVNSVKMAEFTRSLPPFCKDCSHRSSCQGGCKAAAQVCYGSLTMEDPFLRRNLQYALPLRSRPGEPAGAADI